MGKHPPIAAPQPVSFNIPIVSMNINSNSVSNINRLAATSSKSKSRFGGLEVPKISISSSLTKWLGVKSSDSSKNEASSTKNSTKGSFFSKRKKEKKAQEDDDLPDIPLPPAPPVVQQRKNSEEPPARVVKKEKTNEGGGAQVQNKIGSLWRDNLLRTAKKNLGKKLKPRTEEKETRKPVALPTTARTLKNLKKGVISYEEDEEAGPSISTKFPSKKPNAMDPISSAKRKDISGLFSLEEEELSNIPMPSNDHHPKQSEDLSPHRQISISEKKQLEDELPIDVISPSSDNLMALKTTAGDHKGRKVSKRGRQKSFFSTTKVIEKKRKKQKEKTPPTPKKQEVAQLLSPKLHYNAGKAVKSQTIMSTSYPSGVVSNNGKFGQSVSPNTVIDKSRAIISPPGLLNKLDFSFASDYGSSYSNVSYLTSDIKVAERISAVDGRLLTCFFTKVYCFSNHFFKRDLMKIDGVNYICVEQYYMYYKAKVFGDLTAANRVMLANTPSSMKKVGSNIVNFNQNKWRPIAIQVMVIGALRKFEQNPDLRQHLFDTAGSILVEASPSDKYWGVGLGIKSPAIRDIAKWPGLNVLGKP
uniref:NADAR domain-containing protein n=1 Tax=Ditylenchus dipsaci TaxID=166011 RepID=A0A915D0K6_9BILA